ncbi:MAG: two-component regulator propeller domain-containing protein [Candidatus Aminicenantales bacterium]
MVKNLKAMIALAAAAVALAPLSARAREESRPPVSWTAFPAPVRFEALSIEQGLSQSSVVAIQQDRRGFLWFGTENGLNRYDGYTFRVFRNDPTDPESLGDSRIFALLEDSRGRLWVGTNYGGLNLYNPGRETFVRALPDPANPRSLSSIGVSSILEDRNGNIWVGTSGFGLNRLSRESFERGLLEFDRFVNDPADPKSLGGASVNALYEDHFGDLWIGFDESGLNRLVPEGEKPTFARYPGSPEHPAPVQVTAISEDDIGDLWVGASNGLYRLNRASGEFTRFEPDPRDPRSLSHEYVRCLRKDRAGTLWIGTDGGGLNKLVAGRKPGAKPIFLQFRHDPEDPYSLPGDAVESIFEDRTGVLWVGLYYGGLAKLILNTEPVRDREKRSFLHYYPQPSRPDGLDGALVNAILEDHQSVLWIGTDGGGLNMAVPPQAVDDPVRFIHFHHDPKSPGSISDDVITSLYEDRRGNIWVGTYTGGLNRLGPGTAEGRPRTFTHFRNDPNDSSSLSNDFVMSIYEDWTGTLWVGTIDKGLNRYEAKTGTFTRFQGEPLGTTALSDDSIFAILDNPSGGLWVGTADGLNRLDPKTGTILRYLNNPNDPGSISGNNIRAIFRDRKGTFWIGTDGTGLNRMTAGSTPEAPPAFRRYRIKDGLPSDVIFGILEDGAGRLWLSTDNGLSCFDPERDTFTNFTKEDGLQSNEFHRGASSMGRSGEMFFGGYQGFNVFRPENVKGNLIPPQVVIENFQLFNRSVAVGTPQPGEFFLPSAITETRILELSHRQNNLSFEFAALHFVAPEMNTYAYRLEGLENVWNKVGSRRFANYASLPPGRYTFRVIAANGDGVWNEDGVTLGIIIRHPFWSLWWFRAIALIAGLALLTVVIRYRTRVAVEQARKLERKVAERTEELKAANLQLAASVKEKEVLIKEIHHRVKNNMQVVSSLLNLQSASIADQAVVDILKKSRDRVHSMALIHERLYQSRDLARIDFEEYLKKLIVHLFNSYRVDPRTVALRIEVKDIILDINTGIPCALIANELISNALKYAFPADHKTGGEIAIDFRREGDGPYVLTVRDNGVGLPAGFSLDTASSLGLQIVRDLVAQLDGTIGVESRGGTIYTITFPAPAEGKDDRGRK